MNELTLANFKKLDYDLSNYMPDENTNYNFNIEPFKQLNFGINSFATLGNLFLGFKKYNLAKDQLKLAKQQWNITLDEINRIKNVRDRITKEYLGQG